jgi:hypothetical protein
MCALRVTSKRRDLGGNSLIPTRKLLEDSFDRDEREGKSPSPSSPSSFRVCTRVLLVVQPAGEYYSGIVKVPQVG